MEITEISFEYYNQLVELAKVYNPIVRLHLAPIENEEGTIYLKSKEGVSYLRPNGLLGGLARFKEGNESITKLHQQIRINLGGNLLECFDGKLVKLYKSQGFKISARIPFNPEFAPKGWEQDKDLINKPDVVFMSLDAKEVKRFEDYDEALKYSQMNVNYMCRIYLPQRDKSNIDRPTLKHAFDLIGESFKNIRSFTPFLNCIDIHFVGTNDYIRINRKISI